MQVYSFWEGSSVLLGPRLELDAIFLKEAKTVGLTLTLLLKHANQLVLAHFVIVAIPLSTHENMF